MIIADPMVSASWLAAHRGDPNLAIVDCSWWFPHEARDARVEFTERHIPGAVFFDIDAVADPATDLPHMLPSAAAFGEAMGALGIGSDSRVVVYEAGTPRAVGRLWWMLRAFGHDDVVVLDGGLAGWVAEGSKVEGGVPAPRPKCFDAVFRPELVRSADAMLNAIDTGDAQIADARPAARFTGEAAEPRPGLRSGHMPGAHSLPASELFDVDGTLLPAPALASRLAAARLDIARPMVATCGSGITAGLVALAGARLGRGDVAVYDGSWAEWGALPDAPVVTP